ncbi:MAG: ABC transporter permease [Bacteroidia bacterium]
MRLFYLSWKNLLAKPAATLLNLLLLTLGVSIISLLLLLDHQLQGHFQRNVQGIDMVVGAKGSPLQLILSSVYHVDNPTGNMPLAEAEKIMRHPLVAAALPLAYGDTYAGYRILGTDTAYITHYGGQMADGRRWEAPFEVCLGASLARQTGLKVGDTFVGTHGATAGGEAHGEHPYTVVGILAASGTVLDQLVLTDIASVWGVHDKPGQPADSSAREITALLVRFRNPAMGLIMLAPQINRETTLQAALPAIEINKLLNRLLPIALKTGQGIAVAIIVISGISVFISLYSSLRQRRYELALMRSLGASRGQLFWVVLLEGLLLSALGAVLGLLASRAGLWVLDVAVAADYHYDLLRWLPLANEGWLALVTVILGGAAAALPGLQAFSLNISQTLADA